MDRRELFAALGTVGVVPVCGAGSSATAPEHDGKGGPLSKPHFHVCGIHMAKNNKNLQFITQHYCGAHMKGKDADVFQCVLFDSTEQNARLIGVEYIITHETYLKLPDKEKKYWHPHTYEVLGGGLIAPGMKPEEELTFMEFVLTTWGKAWHTWPKLDEALPMGEPLLIWSLMADGQVDKELLATRDKRFNVDTKKLRETRGKAIGLEAPNVSVPKDVNVIGRQWTDTGDDTPTKKIP
jgi:hypothetical protein